MSRLVSLRLDPLLSEPTFIGRLVVASSFFSLGRGVFVCSPSKFRMPNSTLPLNVNLALQLLNFYHPVRLVCCWALCCQEDCHLVERPRLCAHSAFHVLLLHRRVVSFLISAEISLLCCLHLCLMRAIRCMEPCTSFLFGWLDPLCARAARHARARWVIGGLSCFSVTISSFRAGLWLFGSSQGFHSPLCPPDGCALSLSGPQLAPRKTQISYIILHSFSFFLSSLHVLPSRFVFSLVPQCSSPRLSPFPGLFFLHALPGGGLQCRGTCPELSSPTMYPSRFISSSSHFLICVSPQYAWNVARNSGSHIWRFLSVHSVCSKSQAMSIRSPPAAVLFLTHALMSSFLVSKDSSASIVILGFHTHPGA